MISYELLKVRFFFLKSLIHGSAYYQSVHNVIFLLNNIEIRKKNHYTSLVGTYTGALMKGNAFRMHSFSKDLSKM